MNGKRIVLVGMALVALLGLSGVNYSPVIQVVPGPNLPAEVKCQRSNNNLDIAMFQGRLFLAFRTAPTHFAGTKVHHYILSSPDLGKTWDFEAELFMGSDLREPRFLVLGDKLMYYNFQAGKNMFSFTPEHIWAMERKSLGVWTEPRKVFQDKCVLWRAKVIEGKAYAMAYCGEGEYTGGSADIGIYLLTTKDGYNFEPVDAEKPVIATGGSETDFEIDSRGDLYGVIRNEAGDGRSWASKVCTAKAGELASWHCVDSQYKPDSPLVFKHNDEIYVIGRRSLGGAYDKGKRGLPDSVETLYYLAHYWWTKKRTTLYKLDKDKLLLEPILDFPSKGDTSFAGLVQLNDQQYLMYNYSSDPEGEDRVWMSGQLHQTNIYSTIITFE